MRFSLIVCTLGRTDELGELFDSLVRQDRTDFEVILVDQNRDDRLVAVAAQYADRFSLQHLRMTGSGLSRARNLGIEHARGELIGFPDDDCRLLDGYLDAVHQVFHEDPLISAISGHPTPVAEGQIGKDWRSGSLELNSVSLLNRCQEFTVYARRHSLQGLRYNERMGVGAQTLWGADEGPDFLIRLVQTGCRLVYFPRLAVYHPNKIATVTHATLARAAGYARGRGCLFRLHHFPLGVVLLSLLRPAVGCAIYLLLFQLMRSAYYFTVVRGTLRGLLMSRAELGRVRDAVQAQAAPLQPVALQSLPSRPLVSVLVANYNYARYLPAALDSLLAQTYDHWHGIVCDDGSTDDSVQVVERYAGQDARIELVRQTNGGQNSAFNTCYAHARGEIVCFLDADDLFDPRKIQRVVESFQANSQVGMCNHLSQVIDRDGHAQAVTMHRFLDSGWLATGADRRGACVCVPTTSCMSVRREIGDLMFPITPRQDRDLDGYLGMAAQFLAPICALAEPLSSYRIHGNNMGGLTEPTPQRLGYELNLIELRTSNVKEFVAKRFGRQMADRIAPEDNPQYIQAALKLLAIERTDGRLPRALALIRRHPNAVWRAIWRAIFVAPLPLSRYAVPLMHRSYRAKALVHHLLGRGRAVAA